MDDEIMTEKEYLNKYAEGTPSWQKDSIETYICEKHGLKTIYLRNQDVLIHPDYDEECV